MLLADPLAVLLAVLLAIGLDAWLGEPDWLWRRMPHPVVLMGRLIGWLDKRFFAEGRSPLMARLIGASCLVIVLAVPVGAGLLLQSVLLRFPLGWGVEACLMATLLAWRSLILHVDAVRIGLARDLESGRWAVRAIVGRDPQALDGPGVGRAAVESLAENYSDGVVAPIFFAVLLGLPGLLLYKAVNTADSMIGHKSTRYLHYGWAAARLDDLLNLIPARLAALSILLGAGLRGQILACWLSIRTTARFHRSPNAGWPESAVAGALDLRLAGPRVYGGVRVEDGWMGLGSPEVGPLEIGRSIALCRDAYLIATLTLAAAAILIVIRQWLGA